MKKKKDIKKRRKHVKWASVIAVFVVAMFIFSVVFTAVAQVF